MVKIKQKTEISRFGEKLVSNCNYCGIYCYHLLHTCIIVHVDQKMQFDSDIYIHVFMIKVI